MSHWHPISSAPPNVRVLLFSPPDDVEVGYAERGRFGQDGRRVSGTWSAHGSATHWMPLPMIPPAVDLHRWQFARWNEFRANEQPSGIFSGFHRYCEYVYNLEHQPAPAAGDRPPRRRLTIPRKRHRCAVCDDVLRVGVPCARWSGIDAAENEPFTSYAHPECADIAASMSFDEWMSGVPGDIKRPEYPA